MGLTSTTAEEISVGAGEVFYRDSTTDLWVPVGATKDHNIWRVTTVYADLKFNGVIGKIVDTDYIVSQMAELEVTGVEIGATKLGLMVPGARITVETAADATGSPGTTTLAAAAVAGQWEAIKLTAVTNFAVGDAIRVGPAGSKEFRRLTRVGTLGSGGTGVDLDFPLQLDHAALEAFVETDGTGTTIIQPPIIRRLPSAAYHDWRLDVPGLDGRLVRFVVLNGIMSDNAEFDAADDDSMGPRFKIQSRIDPGNTGVGSWRIDRVPAFG